MDSSAFDGKNAVAMFAIQADTQNKELRARAFVKIDLTDKTIPWG